MDLNLNININNSFNKTENSNTELKDLYSTSSKNDEVKGLVITNSQTSNSATIGNIINDSFIKNDLPKNSIIRDIVVGAGSALVATIISYLIFGIK